MTSERRHIRRVVVAAAITAGVLACSSSEATLSCSPTPTCSYHASRLAPPDTPDAGPMPCNDADCRGRAVTAGGEHSCGISRFDELFCWGSDEDGQRGDGTAPAEPMDAGTATRFPFILENIATASAGAAHTCALDRGGHVSCWGRNAEGQVDGVPSTDPVETPRLIFAVPDATAITAGGAHTCAIAPEGVICWGSASHGQSGREVTDGALEPGLVPGTAGAVEVDAGARHTCARIPTGDDPAVGRVVCWGELIDAAGMPEPRADPVGVPTLDDAISITAGAGHSCAIHVGGRAVCWGLNTNGQLGDGTTTSRSTPALVTSLADATAISAGGIELDGALVAHTCALTVHTNVLCWGRNAETQLGIGLVGPDRPVPVQTIEDDEALVDIISISAGGLHSLAIDESADGFSWGANDSDQLGHGGTLASIGAPHEIRLFH